MIRYDDWQFISNFSESHKDNARCYAVKWAVLRLLEKHPKDRFEWAQDQLYDTPRTGFSIRAIPEEIVESVGAHTLDAIELTFDYLPDGELRDKVQAMIALHDLAEAVVGDFTPHDPITKDEKRRIEKITAELIFQKHPDSLALWLEFEDELSDAAKIAHDIEKNQILFRSLDYIAENPEYKDKLDDMWEAVLNAPARTSIGFAMKADAISDMNKLLIAQGNRADISIHL